jgi:hypothetical protein
LIQILDNTTAFGRYVQAGAALAHDQVINQQLSDFPVDFYTESVFKERLHHRAEHHSLSGKCLARLGFRFRFNCVKVGIDPPRALLQGDDLHRQKIHRAIREQNVRLPNQCHDADAVHTYPSR